MNRVISCKNYFVVFRIFLYITGSSIIEAVIKYAFVKKWPADVWDMSFFSLGLIGVVCSIIQILNILNIRSINEHLKKLPYNFDYQKELSTYLIIGKNNPKKKNDAIEYKTYGEWKRGILSSDAYINSLKDNNKENFFRYMVNLYRIQSQFESMLNTIFMPIIIAVVSFYWEFGAFSDIQKVISMFITMMFLMGFMFAVSLREKREKFFIGDIGEVLFNKRFSDYDA
ncbi:hypothetical protein [Eubacterium sp.]|uniref:hypothetical protein n=1 Tax=Eubacterium sp. TaxID=142586 RepID=UPI00258B553B|nr:hypothetical protein [Eubacterium sp.]MCR5368068.1 hypothetical protein [Eubacterium sp.]